MSNPEIEEVLEAWPRVGHAVAVPKNAEHYETLVSLLDRLIDEVGEDENHPLASLMEVLGTLIQAYEDDHVPELSAR